MLRLLTNTARIAPTPENWLSGGMTSGSAPVPEGSGRGRSRDQQDYGSRARGVKTASGRPERGRASTMAACATAACPSGGSRSGCPPPPTGSRVTRPATSRSSAAGSPGCGRRTTSRGRPDAATSGSSRRSSPASARRGATAAGCRASSPGAARRTPPWRARPASSASAAALRATVDEVVAVAAPGGHRGRHRAQRRRSPSPGSAGAGRQRLDGELAAGQVPTGSAVAGRRVRALRPRLRPGAAGPAGVGRRPRRAGARRTHPRGHPRHRRSRPAQWCTDRGTCVRRWCCAAWRASPPGSPATGATWLPMNSAIVVTAPLDRRAVGRDRVGGEELLGDEAHAYCYAQRTADGRIAMGGRGIPYRFGSRTDVDGRTQDRTVESLRSTLDAACSRRWPASRSTTPGAACSACRATGAPASRFDPATGLGHAGGYVGSRAHRDQPGRPHAARPGARPRHRPDPPSVDRAPGAGAGSRSRCGGPACTRCTASTAPPTAARTTVCAAPAASPASRTASRDADLGELRRSSHCWTPDSRSPQTAD